MLTGVAQRQIFDPLDVVFARGYNITQAYERRELRRLLDYLAIDVVFDVGANVGQFASRIRDLGYKGRIVSFEPIAEAVRHLEVLAQNDPLWSVVPAALSATSGEMTLNVMKGSQFSSLLEPSASHIKDIDQLNTVVRRETVQTLTLSEAYETYSASSKRPFLKMDTQGHDATIVSASKETAGRFVGLQSELSISRLYEGAPMFAEVLELYYDCGFTLSSLVPNNRGHFPLLLEVDCLMINTKF